MNLRDRLPSVKSTTYGGEYRPFAGEAGAFAYAPGNQPARHSARVPAKRASARCSTPCWFPPRVVDDDLPAVLAEVDVRIVDVRRRADALPVRGRAGRAGLATRRSSSDARSTGFSGLGSQRTRSRERTTSRTRNGRAGPGRRRASPPPCLRRSCRASRSQASCHPDPETGWIRLQRAYGPVRRQAFNTRARTRPLGPG